MNCGGSLPQEWLGFIHSEVYKVFSPLFKPDTPEEFKHIVRDGLAGRLSYIAAHLASNDCPLGKQFTVADDYLNTLLPWSRWVDIEIAQRPSLVAFQGRVGARQRRARRTGRGSP